MARFNLEERQRIDREQQFRDAERAYWAELRAEGAERERARQKAVDAVLAPVLTIEARENYIDLCASGRMI